MRRRLARHTHIVQGADMPRRQAPAKEFDEFNSG